MYRIRKSIDIDFSHHVRGHRGPCINLHGHTWKFEVDLGAQELDEQGFVVDFSRLKGEVLTPCHKLLDHGLAVGVDTWDDVRQELGALGQRLLASRRDEPAGSSTGRPSLVVHGARAEYPGGMKVAVFPFSPTSERLAHWLFELACSKLDDGRVTVLAGRVYETLRPVEAVAEYLR